MEKLNLIGSQQMTAKLSNGQLCSNEKYSNKNDKNKSTRKLTKFDRRQQSINYNNNNNNGSNNVSNNVNCVPTAKRNNFHEWRPRNRGTSSEHSASTSSGNWRNKVTVETYDDWIQSSDGRKYDSKKQNVNYLLNFSFTPRDNRTGIATKTTFKQKQVYAKFSKEQFLQANCQFIVKAGNDYSLHSADPDLPVNWDCIEEIRFEHFKTQTTACPICLHPPIAAKITKCGHIYCWSCILHYFALSDSSFRKCPICHHAITRDELRSVSFIERSEFKTGEDIELKLMKRKRGSTLTFPVHSSEIFDDNGNKKLIVMNSNKVIDDIISREFNQLCFQLSNEKNTPEACFIESAMRCLDERKKAIELTLIAADEEKAKEEIVATTVAEDSAVNVGTSITNTEKQVHESDDDSENYYFYQSADGQHIYLHSINVRMLCNEYGSFDKCPAKVNGKIISMDWSSMTEEKRKRYRYIQHLPLTCEYRTVELDLQQPLISKKTRDLFKVDLQRRQNERTRREKEERKRDKRIRSEQQRNNPTNANLPRSSNSSETNEIHIPVRTVSESESSSIGDINGNIDEEVQPGSSNSRDNADRKSMSFANMLKTDKAMKKITRKTETVEEPKKEEKVVYVAGDNDDELIAKPLHQYSLSDAFEMALNLKTNSKGKRKNKKRN